MMSRLAVAEIATYAPDAVVVKGDLTSDGRPEELGAFLACYEGAFGDRLTYVRGNHDCYEGQDFASEPFQEVTVPGATVVLLDTARPRRVNGELSGAQLDQLDELGARSTDPVVVLGHHPVWDERTEPRRTDTFGLTPAATEALVAVLARRASLVTYAAGHTHRTRVVELGGVPCVEVAALKDFPGAWCEYQVFDGGILQVVRRVTDPAALAWSERTRAIYDGTYAAYAYGSIEERCRLLPSPRRRLA
jgi:3',5'-cyclic AMP phosphodiesterase CpdA